MCAAFKRRLLTFQDPNLNIFPRYPTIAGRAAAFFSNPIQRF